MSDRRFTFRARAQTVLFGRVLELQPTPSLSAALQTVGLDLAAPADVEWGLAEGSQLLRVLSAELFPGQSAEVAQRALGKRIAENLAKSVLPKAAVWAARMTGARRTLDQLAHWSEAPNSPVHFEVRDASGVLQIWVSDERAAHFSAGIVEAVCDKCGQKARIELLPDAEGACLALRWE